MRPRSQLLLGTRYSGPSAHAQTYENLAKPAPVGGPAMRAILMLSSRCSHEPFLASWPGIDLRGMNDVTIRKTSNAIRRGLAVLMLSALFAGAVAPVAGAQTTSPSCDQYSTQNCVIPNHGGGGGSGSSGLSGRIGSLPFTGFD